MTHRSPFEHYVTAANNVAVYWDRMQTDDSLEPGSPEAFEHAGNRLHDATIATGGAHVEALDTNRVRKGMLVLSRFNYLAALAAANDERPFTVDEFRAIMMHPLSFNAGPGLVAGQQINVAKRAEGHMGVRAALSVEDPEAIERYMITRGRPNHPSYVAISGLGAAIIHEKQSPANDYEPRSDAECAARRADQLRPVYETMTRICIADPSLTPAILQRR